MCDCTAVDGTELLADQHALGVLFLRPFLLRAWDQLGWLTDWQLVVRALGWQTSQIIVQLGTLNVLHDEVKLSRGVDYVVKPHDILVLELFENAYFSNDTFLACQFHQIELFIDFDGKDKPSAYVECLFN